MNPSKSALRQLADKIRDLWRGKCRNKTTLAERTAVTKWPEFADQVGQRKKKSTNGVQEGLVHRAVNFFHPTFAKAMATPARIRPTGSGLSRPIATFPNLGKSETTKDTKSSNRGTIHIENQPP
ncbi:MAG: hypothetical protein V5783_08310 [Pontiella sp.]